MLSKHSKSRRDWSCYAGVAELADARDLKSRGNIPVPVRPRSPAPYRGVEQLVARRAHNPEVAGSNPVPATITLSESMGSDRVSLIFATFYGISERSRLETSGEGAVHRFGPLALGCRCHTGVGVRGGKPGWQR